MSRKGSAIIIVIVTIFITLREIYIKLGLKSENLNSSAINKTTWNLNKYSWIFKM